MDLAVYNYLVPEHMQRPMTKYDAHKQSELKSVLKDIMKLNDTNSPTWLVRLSDEKQTYALGIKEGSIALHASLSSLSDESEEGVFSKKKAYTDSEGVGVDIITENYKRLPEEFNIKINRLARQQINQGNSYYRTGKSLEGGLYRFNMSINDDVYEFQFNVKKNASHEEVETELASFINKAGVGITASVRHEEDNKISLVLEARTTGRGTHGNVFSFQDIGNNRNGRGIVSYYNLNKVIQEPSNAGFTINGESKESQSNSFILNQALHITLREASEKDTHVGYHPDSEKIIAGIYEMMEAYNCLIDFTWEYTSKASYMPKLSNELGAVVRPHQSEMESCGITFDNKGRMKLDEALATQACNEGDMQTLLNGKSPLTMKLQNKTNEIKLNPMEYVEKILVTYADTEKPGVTRSYITSLYSGMLFNGYC